MRRVRALGGTGAEPLDDRAAELLRDNSVDEVGSADHSSPARKPTQQVYGAGQPCAGSASTMPFCRMRSPNAPARSGIHTKSASPASPTIPR